MYSNISGSASTDLSHTPTFDARGPHFLPACAFSSSTTAATPVRARSDPLRCRTHCALSDPRPILGVTRGFRRTSRLLWRAKTWLQRSCACRPAPARHPGTAARAACSRKHCCGPGIAAAFAAATTPSASGSARRCEDGRRRNWLPRGHTHGSSKCSVRSQLTNYRRR